MLRIRICGLEAILPRTARLQAPFKGRARIYQITYTHLIELLENRVTDFAFLNLSYVIISKGLAGVSILGSRT